MSRVKRSVRDKAPERAEGRPAGSPAVPHSLREVRTSPSSLGPPPPSGLPRRPGQGSAPRSRLRARCAPLPVPGPPGFPRSGAEGAASTEPRRSREASEGGSALSCPPPPEPGPEAGAAAAPPARTPPRSRPRRAQRRGPPAPRGPAHCGARHWRRPAGGCSSGREPSGSHRGPSSVAAVLHAGLRREGAAPEGARLGAVSERSAPARRCSAASRASGASRAHPPAGVNPPSSRPRGRSPPGRAPPGQEGTAGRAGRAAAALRLAGVGARGPGVRRWPGLAPRSRAEKESRRLSGLAADRTLLAVVML